MNKNGKVWGSTRALFSKNNVEIHRIEVVPEGFCSKHYHAHKTNGFFVESGSILVTVWKKDYDLVDTTLLEAGEYTEVKPGEYHSFSAPAGPAVVFEIYYLELDPGDIVRETCGGVKIR